MIIRIYAASPTTLQRIPILDHVQRLKTHFLNKALKPFLRTLNLKQKNQSPGGCSTDHLSEQFFPRGDSYVALTPTLFHLR